MLYTLLCTFAPGAFMRAKQLRLEHYTFLREVKASIVEGGPLLGADGIPTGMLMIVDFQTIDDAKAFIAREPYNANGFFETVVIRQWMHVIPEPKLGYIEQEYQIELSTRNTQQT
jgi:uncharacterized protein YciI